MASVNDILGGFSLPGITFNTAALSSSVATAGQLSAPTPIVFMNNSGGTPGTYTSRTAALMIADSGLALGQTWWLFLCNGQGTGTLTLAGGSNVTVVGTATVATNTVRLYVGQVATATTIVFTSVGWSMTATAFAIGA